MVAAQFPTKLANYTEQLITQKNEFQVAMVMQIAVGVSKIGVWLPFNDVFIMLYVDVGLQRVDDIGWFPSNASQSS